MSAEQQSLKSTCLPGYSTLLAIQVTHRNSIYLWYHGVVASYIHLRIKIDNSIKMQYISRSSSALNSWCAQIHPLNVCAVWAGEDPAPKVHNFSNNAPDRKTLVKECSLTMWPLVIFYASHSTEPINTSEGTTAELVVLRFARSRWVNVSH